MVQEDKSNEENPKGVVKKKHARMQAWAVQKTMY